MSVEPTHVLLLYGNWLHAVAHDGARVWGLLVGKPVRVVQCSREDGFITEMSLVPAPDAPAPVLDWGAPHLPAAVTKTDHCWARWLGANARIPGEIGFRGLDLCLPDPLCRVSLVIPTVDGVPLEFVDPPFRPGVGFVEEPVWPLSRRAVTADNLSVPLPGPYDAATADFRSRLEVLFDGLRDQRIFGCDLYGQGWAPKESGDIAAARVPAELRTTWGWTHPSAMSLCWCDTEYELADLREGAASDLYSSNGMDEEWWDRVDVHRLAAPAAITTTAVFYDGCNEVERARIARCVVEAAEAAGLVANWNGDLDRAVAVELLPDLMNRPPIVRAME